MPAADHRLLRPAPTLAWREALDERVLLERSSGRTWLLDPAGSAIWDAVVTTGSLPAALARLIGADPDEVSRFVDELVAQGTLVEEPARG